MSHQGRNLAQLKKQLGFLDVFAVAVSEMIGSSRFMPPGIDFTRTGAVEGSSRTEFDEFRS